LLALLAKLRRELPALRWIAGHEDLDTEPVPASDDPSVLVRRKLDPGPLFPWERVLAASGLERLRPDRDAAPPPVSSRHERCRRRTDRTAVAGAPRGQPFPRPEPRHRDQVRVRRPGARPGAVRRAGHARTAARRALPARLFPA